MLQGVVLESARDSVGGDRSDHAPPSRQDDPQLDAPMFDGLPMRKAHDVDRLAVNSSAIGCPRSVPSEAGCDPVSLGNEVFDGDGQMRVRTPGRRHHLTESLRASLRRAAGNGWS